MVEVFVHAITKYVRCSNMHAILFSALLNQARVLTKYCLFYWAMDGTDSRSLIETGFVLYWGIYDEYMVCLYIINTYTK